VSASRREIESYLLGRLAGADRARVEEALFADDAVFDEVEEAEDRLIRRYLRGRMTAEERAAFEGHFASSAARRDRIAFHRFVLSGGKDEAAAAAAVHARGAARSHARPSLALLAAGIALAIAGAWSLRTLRPPTRSTGPASAGPQVSPPASVAEAPSLPSPGRRVIADVLLHTGVSRGGEGRTPRIAVPEDASEVVLRAAAPPARAARYEATLRTVDGRLIWRGEGRRPDAAAVAEVVAPRERLSPGDYVLSLASGRGAATEYFFRVTRPRPPATPKAVE